MGIELLGGSINVSEMTHLHVDIYPTTESAVNLTPISPGNEKSTSLGALTQDQWNGVDIPLTSYNNVNMAEIIQLKFDGGSGGIFYMDNLFFVNKNATGTNNINSTSLSVFPNPTTDFVYIHSENKVEKVYLNTILGQNIKSIDVNNSEISVDMSNLPTGNYILLVKDAEGNLITTKVQRR